MLTHKQKMAAAKKAHRPWKTVEVALDLGLSEQRDALLAEIAAAGNDQREGFDGGAAARKKLTKLEAEEAESLVSVKIYRTDSNVWARLSANLGYELNSVARAAAMIDGRILDGDDEITQSSEEWEEFFNLLAPSDYSKITAASYLLNEKEPADRVERLKKLSAGTKDSALN